MKAKQAYKLVD
ncbi:Protein of unknown function [Lactobacillus delbrueckii subsp. bulgaricus]|nr:Protein of unknown function [Lactobacillus delbrueckii subsp. bulgaricus]